VRGRREAYRLLDILRKHFPGFRDAQMKSIAPMLGVRYRGTPDRRRCG
jgi:hypothetical protein